MANIPPRSTAPTPLTAERAFIVHLTNTEAHQTEALAGRVEHVSTGRSMRFTSTADLADFMRRAVVSLAEECPPEEAQNPGATAPNPATVRGIAR